MSPKGDHVARDQWGESEGDGPNKWGVRTAVMLVAIILSVTIASLTGYISLLLTAPWGVCLFSLFFIILLVHYFVMTTAFRMQLSYAPKETTIEKERMERFIEDFLSGKSLKYVKKDIMPDDKIKTPRNGVEYRVGFRSLEVFYAAEGPNVLRFGIRDVYGKHSDILADFRAEAARSLGLKP